jgi:cytochrome c-type biogenesis protein CcmH/NrfF
MRRAALLLFALLVLAGAPAVAPTGALAATPRTTLNDVEDELMCDTCNVPLAIAESARADQEREEIRTLIAKGYTKQQILDTFEREYGPKVLAVPKSGGASISVWAVPAGAIVAIALALLFVLPRWRRRPPGGPPPGGDRGAPELDTADAERLERDLAAYDL